MLSQIILYIMYIFITAVDCFTVFFFIICFHHQCELTLVYFVVYYFKESIIFFYHWLIYNWFYFFHWIMKVFLNFTVDTLNSIMLVPCTKFFNINESEVTIFGQTLFIIYICNNANFVFHINVLNSKNFFHIFKYQTYQIFLKTVKMYSTVLLNFKQVNQKFYKMTSKWGKQAKFNFPNKIDNCKLLIILFLLLKSYF